MIKKHSLTFEDKDWSYLMDLSSEHNISISKLLIYAAKKVYKHPLDIILEKERELNKQLADLMKQRERLKEQEEDKIINGI